MMKKTIASSGPAQILRNGDMANSAEMGRHIFEIGAKFSYSDFPYNSVFTVMEKQSDSGTEFRRIQSIIGDDVILELRKLQMACENGKIVFINEESQQETVKVAKVSKAKPKSKKKNAKRRK